VHRMPAQFLPILLLVASLISPFQASAAGASDDEGLSGRLTLRLGMGMSAHSLEYSDGPFLAADFAVGYGLVGGLAAEFQYAFTVLRTQYDSYDFGVAGQVHGFMLGIRYRFTTGPLVPHAGVHVGVARTRDNLEIGGVDDSLNATGFVADARGGLEIFLSNHFAIDVFGSYNLATSVPATTGSGRDTSTAHYLVVGAGVLFAI
jgi:hypothetical protein